VEARGVANHGIGSSRLAIICKPAGCVIGNIFRQWIAGSIFLKCEYPQKRNKQYKLQWAVLCEGSIEEHSERAGCHEASRRTCEIPDRHGFEAISMPALTEIHGLGPSNPTHLLCNVF
jgi:hypothetical protein